MYKGCVLKYIRKARNVITRTRPATAVMSKKAEKHLLVECFLKEKMGKLSVHFTKFSLSWH